MGKCNRCGMCCRAICLRQNKTEIGKAEDRDANSRLILYHWNRITEKKALERNPYLITLLEEYWKSNVKLYWYTCDYLQEDNTCSNHKNRPSICQGYPWYGHPPEGQEFLYGEHCGYMVDLLTGAYKESRSV